MKRESILKFLKTKRSNKINNQSCWVPVNKFYIGNFCEWNIELFKMKKKSFKLRYNLMVLARWNKHSSTVKMCYSHSYERNGCDHAFLLNSIPFDVTNHESKINYTFYNSNFEKWRKNNIESSMFVCEIFDRIICVGRIIVVQFNWSHRIAHRTPIRSKTQREPISNWHSTDLVKFIFTKCTIFKL